MTEPLPSRRAVEAMIREKLIELIRLSVEHRIDITMLMYEAIDIVDPESG